MTQISDGYFDEQKLAIEKLIAAGDLEAYVLLREFGFVESDLLLADLCCKSSLIISLHSYSMTEKGSEYLYSPGYGLIAVRAEKKEELINFLEANDLVSAANKENSSKRQSERFAQGKANGAKFDVVSPPIMPLISNLESKVAVEDADINNVDNDKHESEPVINKNIDDRGGLKSYHGNDWLWVIVFWGGLFLVFKYGFEFKDQYPGALEKVFFCSMLTLILYFFVRFLFKNGIGSITTRFTLLLRSIAVMIGILFVIAIIGDCSGKKIYSSFDIENVRK